MPTTMQAYLKQSEISLDLYNDGWCEDPAGRGIEDPVWDVTVFTKNRDRLLDGDVAARLFQAVLSQPSVRALLSDEHFSVDGTLIEAFASMKSFKPKAEGGDGPPPGDAGGGRNAERDFHGERRRNNTHASTTDPDARLYRRGVALRGDHRRSPLEASHGEGGQALPHGPPADGKPQWSDRRCPDHGGHRHRRTRCRRSHAGPPGGSAPGDASSRARSSSLTITETSCAMPAAWHRFRTM